jgi:TatD DNase family protein
MMLVDSHCHFDLIDHANEANSSDNIIARALQNDVRFFLNVCVDLQHFSTVLQTAEKHANVACSVGVHPNEQTESLSVEKLVELAQHKKVIAIGETGLDYFRTVGDTEWQREQFRIHIRAAKLAGKPLIIHTREAQSDTIRVMQEERANDIGGVMHCFTENWEMAQQALDLGFYISFSGVVTFKSAAVIQDTARRVPLDRMLIETDAPYLAPVPFRGKQNEPSYVRYTAEYIASLRGISFSALAEATTNNFFHLFKGAERPHV